MFGPIIGPMLGGWITDNWSWNWIFYINIPIGILSIVMIGLFIHDPVYLKRTKQKIDFRGLGLLVVGLGALQVVLDKGQREDWFSSGLIVRLSLVAAACLIAFIIVELRSPEPVVKLRLFKNISFAAGNLVQFFAFFVLFGSIVLVPIYLQQLMGYTAYLAGLALAPGGIATLFSMPLVGILVAKYNPKGLMVFGIIVTAYSMLIMSSFSLQTDLDAILWSRIVMGFGLSFVFIPMVTMTLSGVPKEEMGYATAIFNLLRNLGGSFGVAFITTIVARRAQFHQARFAENLTPFHLPYRAAGQFAGRVLQSKGVSPAAADGIIYQRLIRESNMMAFRDTFFFSAVIMISVLLLVFFLKRPKGAPAVGAMH
jgi:DHA2 family multidrug resistance protein